MGDAQPRPSDHRHGMEGTLGALMTDLRYGARMLRKTPGHSLIAVLTIALGVGLTTFTWTSLNLAGEEAPPSG